MLSPRPTLPERLADRAHAGLVLIVDDVPDNLAVLHDALDAAGYTVLVATEGASARSGASQARQSGRAVSISSSSRSTPRG